METRTLKTGILLVSIAIATVASAQSSTNKQTKTCINIHENINGKVINIDTCYTGSDPGMEKWLDDMGMTSAQDKDDMNGYMNMVVNDDDNGNGKKTEIIIIKHGGDNDSANHIDENIDVTGPKTYAYSYTVRNDTSMTVDDGKDGGSTIVVKNSKGNMTVVSTCGNANTKVYMFKNVVIRNITDSDKKVLPADATSGGSGFADLNMYPNPSEGSIAVTYTSNSDEPLQITVYDINGKQLETETINNMKGEVSRTIPLSSYGQGIYFVRLTQGNQSETRKVIVK